jgi:two-component system LytT family response regulator
MLNAFVVDDERLAVERLTRLLRETGRVRVVGTATDPMDALEPLTRVPVDVLFLDIQMPGLSGFDLLERLHRPIPVVFTTAYDAYAVDAFEVNSVDYLLKPIEAERLSRAIDRLERVTAQPSPDIRALARELAAHLAERPQQRPAGPAEHGTARRPTIERVASRVGDRTTILEVNRIAYFFSRDKLTLAVAAGHEHAIDFSLAELEDTLDPRRFVRIHRSSIVNTAFVHELDAWFDGGVLVRLKDEKRTELPVARDRVRELRNRLGIGPPR